MSTKYMMVARNFNSGELNFPYCDVSRREIDDAFTVHLRELAFSDETGEIPFFMKPGASLSVFLNGAATAAHGFWMLAAYSYAEGQVEIDLSGSPEFAYCAWKRKPDNGSWAVWSANDCSVLASEGEAEEKLFRHLSNTERQYTKSLAQKAMDFMMLQRVLEVSHGRA